jgi:hypothetical protein
MISFRVVPLRLEIRGQEFKRGDIVHFDKIYFEWSQNSPLGAKVPYGYRLWESRYRSDKEWQYFTQKQLDAMQPHWLTRQNWLDL